MEEFFTTIENHRETAFLLCVFIILVIYNIKNKKDG